MSCLVQAAPETGPVATAIGERSGTGLYRIRQLWLPIQKVNKARAQKTTKIFNKAIIELHNLIGLLYRRVRKTNRQLQDLNTQLEFYAMRDPLTGLFNRPSFVNAMATRGAAVHHERRKQAVHSAGMVLMDIDHFKQVNDTLGAYGWRYCVAPVVAGELSSPITMTAGFAALPIDGTTEVACDWQNGIQLIDLALYLGKQNGRNRPYGIMAIHGPVEDRFAYR